MKLSSDSTPCAVPEVFQKLETLQTGLSAVEAESRRSLYERECPFRTNRLLRNGQKFLRQVRHPFNLLMFLAAIISLWQKDWTLALIILLLSLGQQYLLVLARYRGRTGHRKNYGTCFRPMHISFVPALICISQPMKLCRVNLLILAEGITSLRMRGLSRNMG